MYIAQVKDKIVRFLKEANSNCVIPDENEDLFSSFCHIAPRDLVYALLELSREYPMNFNLIIEDIEVFSINSLANAINAQIIT